jgi:2-polyprenyl-3-methyl-5-hydroxy-6-metoxy-1,4-benzoquinol methylase/ribosomal protein S27E
LKNNQIRPESLIKKQKIFLKKDIKNLLKYKSFFLKVNCPACGNKKSDFFLEKKNFIYKICNLCRTYFVNPRPTEDILNNFYKKSLNNKYWAKKIFPISRNKRIKYIHKPRANYLINVLKKKINRKKIISFLEIGAGDGGFAYEIRKKNFFSDIILIEPNPECAKICKKKNFTVLQENFEYSYKKITGTDCVVFFEVIEHIYSPINFLIKVKDILRPKGKIFFSCPNGEGLDVSLMQDKSDTIDHEHLNYFNFTSIKILLKKTGFKILSIETPGKLDLDLVYNSYYNDKINDLKYYHRINWVKNLNLKSRNNLQNFIQKNHISSHMLILAEKI